MSVQASVDHIIKESQKDSEVYRNFLTEFIEATLSKEPFPIKIDLVVGWTGMRKDNITRHLNKYYEEKIDYVKDTQDTKGRPLIGWFLSVNCLKQLIIELRSVKCQMIKQYFIDIEEIYRKQIIEIIENRKTQEDDKIKA